MGREVPFDPNDVCDWCGAQGAYDFYGDLLCDACATPPLPVGPKGRVANGRKTHCNKGHEFTAANTKFYAGRRYCRECRRAFDRRRGLLTTGVRT